MNSASCILIVNKDKGEFLSVSLKDDKTDFNLPGGKVELNETLEDTAIRETKEETGINIYKMTFLHNDVDKNYNVTTFYTNFYDGEINTKESHEVKWLPLYELTKSKKWFKYNNTVYNKYINLKI